MQRLAGLAMMLVMGAPAALAQDAHDDTTGVSNAIGLHYGTPLRASLAAGLMYDRNSRGNDGLIMMLEQGFQGSEASVGYFRMFSWFGSGYSLRAAVVRTGDDPWNASPHTTYAGAEAHLMLALGVGGRIGYLRRTSRSETDPHDTVISVGVSIGH